MSQASKLKIGGRIAGLVEWVEDGDSGVLDFRTVKLYGQGGYWFFIDPKHNIHTDDLLVLEKVPRCPCGQECGNVGWEVVEDGQIS